MSGGTRSRNARIPRIILGMFLAAGTSACEDGGWGEPLPDTLLGDLPDGETVAGDVAGGVEAGGPDGGGTADGSQAGDSGVVYACGEGPGNEKGVGKPCTKGGGECTGDLSCDVDLDAKGVGVCVLLMCSSDKDCGSGATCCTPSGSPIKVCIINECLPPECGGVVPDGGVDGGGGGDGT
ncbi:MAG: hypothetical protein HY897_19665 [Deltaproteobacteria bacterium]|nr:hypothetical protein [Deltaproteobacteria bacterium]